MSSIVPVVLSGGAGTRLWPLSRRNEPKQFQSLTSPRSMLELTLARVDGYRDHALVMASIDHVDVLVDQAAGARIVAEPSRRNTAPAIAAAALLAPPNAILVVMPADHHIAETGAFRHALDQALTAAESGLLVTFGIVPDREETGYGYIVPAVEDVSPHKRIVQFVEKPDVITARALIDRGALWNSGMFVFPAALVLAELERFEPELMRCVRAAVAAARNEPWGLRLGDEFSQAPNVSVDVAVMERTPRAAVVSLDAGWSDIGSWATLWELGEKDAAGNVVRGPVTCLDSRSSYLRSEGPTLAVSGVEDLVIVATPDAVLVTTRENAQSVRSVVEMLASEDR